jgi:hypothetical protein
MLNALLNQAGIIFSPPLCTNFKEMLFEHQLFGREAVVQLHPLAQTGIGPPFLLALVALGWHSGIGTLPEPVWLKEICC